MLPVTNGFVIGIHPFQGDGSIEQSEGIVGLFCKDPAEELYGLPVVDRAVCCFGALEIGGRKISKQWRGIRMSVQQAAEGSNRLIIVSLQELNPTAGCEHYFVVRPHTQPFFDQILGPH